MTPAQLREIVGDTIPAKIYDGSGYTDVNFQYAFTSTVQRADDADLGLTVGQTVVCWDCTVSGFIPSTDRQFVTVDLQPLYSFFDTQSVDMVCGLSAANDVSASVYSSPQWFWYQSGYGDRDFYNTFSNSSGLRSCVVVQHNNVGIPMGCTAVRASMSSQSTFSAYSKRVCFYGNSNYSVQGSRGYLFFLSLPTVSDNSTFSSGTFVTTQSGGSGGDVNVTVDVDMTETNGLLGSLLDVLEGIVDGIAGLFVPSEQALEDFKDDMQDLLSEHLGGLYEAQDALLEYADSIVDADTTATSTIVFPAVSVPVGGNNVFVFGGYNVDVKPFADDFDVIYDALALLVDVIATTAFVQMCRRKLEVFLHPEGEVIES